MSEEWFTIATIDELPDGAALAATAGGVEVAVFNHGGELHALDNRCLHRGGPLAQGVMRDGVVTCPFHLWRYEVMTGRCIGSSGAALRRYKVRAQGGRIEVLVPRPAPPRSWRQWLLAHAREGRGDQ